jgi:hypothetical protein
LTDDRSVITEEVELDREYAQRGGPLSGIRYSSASLFLSRPSLGFVLPLFCGNLQAGFFIEMSHLSPELSGGVVQEGKSEVVVQSEFGKRMPLRADE